MDNAGAPTAADDARAELLSGNLTIDGTSAAPSVCRSFDIASGVGTWAGTLTAGSTARLDFGDGTAGAGNVALRLGAGITFAPSPTSDFRFISSSATQQTVDFGGKTMGTLNFVSTNPVCNYAITTGIVQDASATLFHGRGALHFDGTADTAGLTHNLGIFSTSTNNTRTLFLGNATFNISGAGNAWNAATGTLLTLTAGNSIINMITAAQTFQNGGTASAQAYNTVNFTGSGQQLLACGSGGSFVNVTRTGTGTKTDSFTYSSGTTIISGILTITGNSPINRMYVRSSVLGSTRNITNTGATVTLTNVVLEDIAFSTTVNVSSQTDVSDQGGNSGVTFPPGINLYWVGNTGLWSETTHWSTSSGGSSGARVPLLQDDCFFDANSFSTASQTVNFDMPQAGRNIDMSAVTNTPTFNGSANPSYFMGSMVLPQGSIGNSNRIGSSVNWHFRGRNAAFTLTSNGKTISPPFTVYTPGGSFTLADAMTKDSSFSHIGGTFSDGGFNVTMTQFTEATQDGVANTRALNATGAWTLTGTGTVWNLSSITNLTFTSMPSSITMSNTTVTTKTFAGAGQTYPNVIAADGGASQLVISGANTFTNFKMGDGRTLAMPASTTTTFVNAPDLSGTPYGYNYLPGNNSNNITSPDSAALDITSDIDLRVKVALGDWTPSAFAGLVSKYTTVGNQLSYTFRVTTAGLLQLTISNDGTATSTANSTVATGIADGTAMWVRVTWVDSTNIAQFFTSPDGTNWTQLGANATCVSTGIFASTAALEIGSNVGGTANLAIGNFYRVQVYNGVAGTLVFDADFTTKAFGANSFTESSANAATVTMNGAPAQVGDGRVSLVSTTPATAATVSKPLGIVSEDYMTIQDSTATGGASWYAGSHSINVSGNTGWIFTDAPFTKRVLVNQSVVRSNRY